MSSLQITQTTFNELVSLFKKTWETADENGLAGERTETAMRSVLAVLDIEVLREWKDGDVVYTSRSSKVPSWFVRSNGSWHELPVGQHYARTYADSTVDDKIRDGLLKVWQS